MLFCPYCANNLTIGDREDSEEKAWWVFIISSPHDDLSFRPDSARDTLDSTRNGHESTSAETDHRVCPTCPYKWHIDKQVYTTSPSSVLLIPTWSRTILTSLGQSRPIWLDVSQSTRSIYPFLYSPPGSPRISLLLWQETIPPNHRSPWGHIWRGKKSTMCWVGKTHGRMWTRRKVGFSLSQSWRPLDISDIQFESTHSSSNRIPIIHAMTCLNPHSLTQLPHPISDDTSRSLNHRYMPQTKLTSVTCPKCDAKEAYFMQLQIRSADEPSTTF